MAEKKEIETKYIGLDDEILDDIRPPEKDKSVSPTRPRLKKEELQKELAPGGILRQYLWDVKVPLLALILVGLGIIMLQVRLRAKPDLDDIEFTIASKMKVIQKFDAIQGRYPQDQELKELREFVLENEKLDYEIFVSYMYMFYGNTIPEDKRLVMESYRLKLNKME